MGNNNNEVVLVGRAELDQIAASLDKIRQKSEETGSALKEGGRKIDESMIRSTKTVENSVKNTSSLTRRMLNSLYSDMKALISLQSVTGALKLSSQFSGAIKESISLSDTIRRLGGSFGLARNEFGSFQASLAKGLGNIGASSEAAAQALEGLTGLGVKGAGNAQRLVSGAVTLAGMSGEKGNERNVASALGSAIKSQGKSVNDPQAVQKTVGEVTAAVSATGKTATEILGAMNEIFSKMPEEMRKKVGPELMAQMATIGATVGPDATKALQEFMTSGTIKQGVFAAQGFGGVVGKNGQLDMKQLMNFINTTKGRIGFDTRAALKTAGFSEDAADGLLRIADQSASVEKNLQALGKASRDNVEQFRKTMGFADSFRANINTVLGDIESVTGGWAQKATDMLQSTVGTKGAAAVTIGGGLVAAMLAGAGLKGIGGALGGMGGIAGGVAKGKALEQAGVQPVYVVNAKEIGGGGLGGQAGGLLGGLAGAGGMLGRLATILTGPIGMIGAAAVAGGVAMNNIDTETDEGFKGNAWEALFFKMSKWFGGENSDANKFIKNQQKIQLSIENKHPNLRPVVGRSRGSSN